MLAVVTLVMVACEPPLDRGQCLQPRVVAHHTDEEFSCVPTIGFDGDIGISCNTEPAHDWTETVCDRWEFPNGKAERD